MLKSLVRNEKKKTFRKSKNILRNLKIPLKILLIELNFLELMKISKNTKTILQIIIAASNNSHRSLK